jgi:hypothetical protein
VSVVNFDADRGWADEVLLDDCTILRSGGSEPVFDEGLGRSVPAGSVTVWSGRCSVSLGFSGGDRRVEQGGAAEMLVQWIVRVPIEVTDVVSGDIVRIDAVRPGGDGSLPGRRFVVRRVGARSAAVLRRLYADALEQTTP